jgi:oligopeptidase A
MTHLLETSAQVLPPPSPPSHSLSLRGIINSPLQQLADLEAKIEHSGYQLPPKDFLQALEVLGHQMETSWSAVSHLKAVKDSEQLRAAVEAVQPQIVAFGLKVGQSLPIYKQYKSTLAAHGKELSEPQLRIVEKGIQGAEHAGVALEGLRARSCIQQCSFFWIHAHVVATPWNS